MDNERLRVLAVDDDATSRVLFGAIAKRYDLQITVVCDCDDALSALTTTQFDVLLMDWQLPNMNGMECVRLLRKDESSVGKDIPIIAVTAHALDGHREQCLEAGCNDYLSKPFKADELNATIRRWASRSA